MSLPRRRFAPVIPPNPPRPRSTEVSRVPSSPGGPRFTLITLALAGTYLLLQHGWMALGGLGADWWQARQNAALVDDAEVLAARSREAEARLPPQRRVDAFRLGQQMGFLAEYLGSHALSDAAVRAQAEARAAPLAAQAGTLAEVLGVAPAVWPAVSTADEFARLQARFERR
jgi:hypothetical protein